MDCPRCQTQLKTVEIDLSEVYACPGCEGAWYPDEALGSVTDHTFSELKATELRETMVPDRLALVDLEQTINCPVCSETMLRYTYSLTCPIELDECPKHGIWLDDGELGTLVQYLNDLDKRVNEKHEMLMSERNIWALHELSKSSEPHSLPGEVLAVISNVYARER